MSCHFCLCSPRDLSRWSLDESQGGDRQSAGMTPVSWTFNLPWFPRFHPGRVEWADWVERLCLSVCVCGTTVSSRQANVVELNFPRFSKESQLGFKSIHRRQPSLCVFLWKKRTWCAFFCSHRHPSIFSRKVLRTAATSCSPHLPPPLPCTCLFSLSGNRGDAGIEKSGAAFAS